MNTSCLRSLVQAGLILCPLILSFLPTAVNAADAKIPGWLFEEIPNAGSHFGVRPINHASLALSWDVNELSNVVVYVDPVGDAKLYAQTPKPQLILLTHTHPDHLSADTLKAVASDKTVLVAPASVAAQLPAEFKSRTTILTNGQSATVCDILIEAIPMYNTTPERAQYHPKGQGNGYVLSKSGGLRVYVSGDTEDIPEMRALKNIDVAFVCMNLPYTMTEDQAASAVKAFKPKIVYPYHYKGSDVQKFKTLVGTNSDVNVRLDDWYAK